MVSTLQFISYFEDIRIARAAHLKTFLAEVKKLALGQFIPYEPILNEIKDAYTETDFTVLEKMGSFTIILMALGAFTGLLLLTNYFVKKYDYQDKLVKAIRQKVFWNMFIRSSL